MTLAQMVARVSARLGEPSGAVSFPAAEIVRALNESQNLFTLLTLALETTAAWTVQAATPFTRLLPVFPDFIVPLRLTTAGGVKIRPARLAELNALDAQWLKTPGTPTRYAMTGVDLAAIYPQPAAPLALNLTYARAPLALVSDADVSELPNEFCPSLIGYAQHRLRQLEGLGELSKTLPLLGEFLDAAQKYGDFIRARNKSSGYEAQPFELKNFDRSDLLRLQVARAA